MRSMSRIGESGRPLLIISALGCLEFLGAGLAIIFGFREAGLPLFSGLSVARLSLAALAFVLSASILAAGVSCIRREVTLPRLFEVVPAGFKFWLVTAGILAAAAGWISIFSPADMFGAWSGYFLRLRPLLIAAGLFVSELWIAIWLGHKTGPLSSWMRDLHIADRKVFLIALLLLGSVWLFMLLSKFGIDKISAFWNPPGIPLTGLQGVGVLVILCLGALWKAGASDSAARSRPRAYWWLVPIAIYICALLVWGLAPMPRHYFSLRPARPSYQPFPFSDARTYDLGALSILDGQGVYFHGFTVNPLYMVLLAFLHVLADDNYVLLTWLQIAVLAGIPVMLFLLGRQFHSGPFGVGVALMTILQQANSIAASRAIDSVNPKLLMSEVPTLLGMTVVAYLLFRWFRTRKPHYALASGAAIAAASLIRVNPLFLLPVAGIVAALVFRRQRRLATMQILLFLAGFIVIFSPWLVTGVNQAGVPWLWVKFQLVIQQRFQTMVAPPKLAAVPELPIPRAEATGAGASNMDVSYPIPGSGGSPFSLNAAIPDAAWGTLPRSMQSIEGSQLVPRMLSHLLHNMAAALLSLPDLVTLDNLDQLSQKGPWGRSPWRGELTLQQHLAAAGNLVLLAIGLAWSWRRFRLAGLVPALVFLGYDLSLAVATTSGGRYIVPVNWAAHFYYALGWIVIIDSLTNGRPATSSQDIWPPMAGAPAARGSFVPSIVVAVFVAMLIPVANIIVPIYFPPRIEERARSQLATVSPDVGAEAQLVYGKVLYPYHRAHSGSVSFDLLTDSGYQADVTVANRSIIPYTALRSGALAVARLSTDNVGPHVKFLYVGEQK